MKYIAMLVVPILLFGCKNSDEYAVNESKIYSPGGRGCNFEERSSKYSKYMAENNYNMAIDIIRPCADATGEPIVLDMLEEARKSMAVQYFLNKINDVSSSNQVRLDAFYNLNKINPDLAKPFEEGLKKYMLEVEKLKLLSVKKAEKDAKIAEREDRFKRKREGVNLGMSQQEVIESSWGKPSRINRTITTYSTNEQWVYPNGNYLYFKDGVLTTVQN